MAYISKNLQHPGKQMCVRLLRPRRGSVLFSTSKTVYLNMNVSVDFCVRTLYDQICVYKWGPRCDKIRLEQHASTNFLEAKSKNEIVKLSLF